MSDTNLNQKEENSINKEENNPKEEMVINDKILQNEDLDENNKNYNDQTIKLEDEEKSKESEEKKTNDLNKKHEISEINKSELVKNERKENLLNSVKSIHIMKKLFSNLNCNKKLNMIKYNKNIQKKFEINIEDYKKESGKYIIYGKNGKRMEYLLDTNAVLNIAIFLYLFKFLLEIYHINNIVIYEGEL